MTSKNDPEKMTFPSFKNAVTPFYLTGENTGNKAPLIRGRLARLFSSCENVLVRHGYPDSVNELCAEAMSLAACLSTILKFDGIFVLQAKGDGVVQTLFADVTSAGHIRSYATFDEDRARNIAPSMPALLQKIIGAGHIAFTVDQDPSTENKDHRYQGIIELAGQHLGDCATIWLEKSEQLAAKVITIASKTPTGWHGAALFVQQIAQKGETEATDTDELDEYWQTVMMMMSSVTKDEILNPDLPSDQLLYRLFHAHGLHVQPARPVLDVCRCSAEKVELMLDGLTSAQLYDLSDTNGQLVVNCEFCKTEHTYHYQQFASPH